MIDLYQPIMSWKLSWCIHIKYKRQLINAFKHKPSFKVAVKLKNTSFVEAEGFSKKLAQQAAATKLLSILEK